jgi:class 3 adenylate cyclase
MSALPGGTVTFVFTDVEGSTRLLQQLGDGFAELARDHRRIVREAFGARGGTEIDTQGDSFFFSFPRARDAVAAAVDAQRALRDHAWPEGAEVRVRMGLHTGEPQVGEEGYLGLDVVRAARISAAGHGGQILVSETTRALLGNQLPEGVAVHDLGAQNLKDIQHEHIYEISVDGAPAAARPLKTERANGDFGTRLEERINTYVEQQLERAFSGGTTTPPSSSMPVKVAAGGLTIAVLSLLAIAVIVVLIVLLVIFVL